MRLLISMSVFLVLLGLSVTSIVLGFLIIEVAETTVIKDMSVDDWFITLTGTTFVFGSVIFIMLMKLIRRIR